MPPLTDAARLRAARPADYVLLHHLYLATPGYFEIISIPIPTLSEVETELTLAVADPRRHVELLLEAPGRLPRSWSLRDPVTQLSVVGLLDYKLDYPEAGDATVNLLLIPASLQSSGIGRRCVAYLEEALRGRCTRILASIYGQNRRAEKFWRSLGYRFAIDAQPNLDWYAKELAV
jgi:ribosomal protein S18 acetylase RimI-like enzyme